MYRRTGHFVEAVFENWESEFLQMGLYVLLTAYLFQRGSAESKDPDGHEAVDDDPRVTSQHDDTPWPVRRGGIVLTLYQHSLGAALIFLFLVSLALHAAGDARVYNEQQLAHGGDPVSTLGCLATSQMSIAVVVARSIFLRQQGSPESKPVAAPHSVTGEG